MKKSIFIAALVMGAQMISGQVAAATPPTISAAWIGEAPPVAKHRAGFVVFTNGEEADTLLSAQSPVAEAVELHTVTQQNGTVKMQPLSQVELAAKQIVHMAPGAMHLMLINVKQPLKVGDHVPLTLVFRKAGKITVEAEVKPLVVPSQHQHEHNHGHHAH